MPREIVVDTTVLQKANAPITDPRRMGRRFARRVDLLLDISRGDFIVLFSPRLVHEYRKQVPVPRNDFVTAFLAIISGRRHSVENWAPWPTREQEKARKCRFPKEDDHVLRTAIRPGPSEIVSEEQRMLATDACTYRAFRVHIRDI